MEEARPHRLGASSRMGEQVRAAGHPYGAVLEAHPPDVRAQESHDLLPVARHERRQLRIEPGRLEKGLLEEPDQSRRGCPAGALVLDEIPEARDSRQVAGAELPDLDHDASRSAPHSATRSASRPSVRNRSTSSRSGGISIPK